MVFSNAAVTLNVHHVYQSCHERVKLGYSKGLMQSSDDVASNGAWAVGGRGDGGNLGGGGGAAGRLHSQTSTFKFSAVFSVHRDLNS